LSLWQRLISFKNNTWKSLWYKIIGIYETFNIFMAINLNFGSEVKIFYINVSYGVQNFQRIRSFSATKLIKSCWFNIQNLQKRRIVFWSCDNPWGLWVGGVGRIVAQTSNHLYFQVLFYPWRQRPAPGTPSPSPCS